MRPLARLVGRKASFSSIGQTLQQPPFWVSDAMRGGFLGGRQEGIESSFEGYVRDAYEANGIVFACILARLLPFSEARFQFQHMDDGRPADLFDAPSLRLLDTPWQNGTTGDLLARMEQDASLAGNAYHTTVNGRVRRLRPDWVRIISGVPGDDQASAWALESEILAYVYHVPGSTPVLLTPGVVSHYAPIPDPLAQWRGMSWLTPILSEIDADSQATKHKLKFFRNGASLGVVVSYDKSLNPKDFGEYVRLFDAAHTGTDKAYKTLHIGGGADAKVVGADLKQLDFKATQGAGETRIAAAAGVGAIMARFSEGLAGSSLNAGNYSAAKRQFADMTLRPHWRQAAGALAKLVDVPANARLWYDARDVEFLKEDRADAASILQVTATTIRALVDAGYDPDVVVKAIETNDLTRLVGAHTGLFSVQLQQPGGGA